MVGSGPGGATAARALARAGRRVLLLERGADHRSQPYYGTYLGALLYTERGSLLTTTEGMQIVRPLLVGGATSMYCGCAAPPPTWLAERYGIDLSREVGEACAELGVAPLPADLRGAASTDLAMAGRRLGYDWEPQAKLMAPGRERPFDCGAHCMLGCRCSAKWSAGSFVDQAVASGATLVTGAHVGRAVISDGRVIGVEGRVEGEPFVAQAETVILAAGGIGTPRILQESGLRHAGDGLTMDTTLIVYGMRRAGGIGHEPPMTWAWMNQGAGYMLSTLIDPWLMYPLAVAQVGLGNLPSWAHWSMMAGVMIKIKDELAGRVGPRMVSKPATAGDRARIAEAQGVAQQILVEAGADPASIFASPLRGTHPASSVRIGGLLDGDLRTEIAGLYVCDASAFPEALGQPTVLTIIGLAKRLAAQLVRA